MVEKAEAYRWSSAAAHCGQVQDDLLNPISDWSKQFFEVEDWSAWLAEGDEAEKLQILRRNADKGLPCGSERFVQALGALIGRVLVHRPQGRPQKIRNEG